MRPRSRAQVLDAIRQGQDGHDLGGDGDVITGRARHAVLARAQADGDLAQLRSLMSTTRLSMIE